MSAQQVGRATAMRDEGPRRSEWLHLLGEGVTILEEWEANWPGFARQEAGESGDVATAVFELAARLHDNQPYFHPLYAGHMIKPPHPVAWVAYALAALVNPNNQTRESGQATTEMELEAVDQLKTMLGLDPHAAGHLTSSGTIANLEAMWIARELHPDRAIACSEAAHYNYARIANLIGTRLVTIPCRANETIDPEELGRVLKTEDVGTMVATLGTTGLGVVDPLDAIVEIAARHDCRVHVDAAYGGFFSLIADDAHDGVDAAAFGAISRADSITIDPHKHGLQPYGCGCILHRDPAVLRHFHHDSPYTYADREALHMGQIQLECSRSGAAAAALWTTLSALPLQRDRGLGPMLAACRRAARDWSHAIEQSELLRNVVEPQLDILTFVVWPAHRERVRASELTAWTLDLIEAGQTAKPLPFYLTRYDLDAARAARLWPSLDVDADVVSVARACVMKPEHERWWSTLHLQICETAARLVD